MQDRRGHHTPSNKTSEEEVDFVIRHILSMKPVRDEALCAFSGNQLQGLPQGQITAEVTGGKELSVKKMYELYKRLCQEEGRAPVSLWVYRHIEKSRVHQENNDRNYETLKKRDFVHSKTQTVSNTIEYKPLTNNSNLCNGVSSELQEHVTDSINVTTEINIRKKKKVGDNGALMSRKDRKAKRNSGAAYFTASGKLKKEKLYVDKECGCKYRCIPEMGTPESRKKIFDCFWKLADFSKQNTYIAQKVALVPIMQKDEEKVIEKFTRTYTRIYNVQLKDRRGHHSPKNKTQEEDINYACCHIRSFPTEYHNSEANATGRLYLPHDLNVEKMYRMYKEQCVRDDRVPIGSFVYRKILKERFNCFIKSPANKTSEEDLQYAYQHIQSCSPELTGPQKDAGSGMQSNLSCTSQETSVKKLHIAYIEKCLQEGKKPVGIDVYRKIFNSKFRLKQDLS
ncbi:hypothetical protein Hamer_G017967 [Homarus americanus]|uniref:Uncharacterized protein n=1 Tax=Homarus americanus TaxID=6706 RepID=A0A8J5N5Y8_HOMAM|nr:hypothetical protein Hamer_G017967 [Homarus americanus]